VINLQTAKAALGLTLCVVVASLVAGCAWDGEAGRMRDSPPLHRGPGGTYVPGDTSYHGSGGP